VSEADLKSSLVIDDFRPAGLHKPTAFRLDLSNRKRLPWCEEYFITQGYVRSQNIITGSLTEKQITQAKERLAALKLTFPLP
jgi:hypothetical protein